jgi:hypothetical protein
MRWVIFIPLLYYCREKLTRVLKAKDQYGPVIDIVEKKRRELAQDGITDLHHDENEGQLANADKSDSAGGARKGGADTSMALYR